MDEQALTARQECFVQAYLANGGNGTQAAISAGYSPDCAGQTAYDLMQYPHVSSKIEAGRKSLAERCGLTEDWIVQKLQEEATSTAPGTTGASRIRALELLAKVRGMSVMEQAAALEAAGFTITLKRDDRREQPTHANERSTNTAENEGVT